MTEIIEGEIVERNGGTALAVRDTQAISEWTPRFAITVDQAVEIVEQKREFMKRVMRPGEHYGVIPGTDSKDKPGKDVLFKAGAELLLSSMGLHPRYRDTAPAIEDWLGTEHGGEPFFRYRKTCMVTRQTGPGPDDYIVIAEAGGNANSWEKKYRYRNATRICPECGEATIIKGKAEFGGGWLCWKKKGGCGEKFVDTDPRITKQEAGQVPNPDIADLANTLEKMADKRALVAATLLATGCSDIFTQDLEDGVDTGEMNGYSGGEGDHGQGAPEPAKPKQRQRSNRQAQGSDQRQQVTAPSHVSTDRDSTAGAETPAPAEATGELGRMDVVVNLAALLPKTPKTRPEVEAFVKQYGFANYLKSVVNQHKLQCGSKCPHLADGEEEPPF